jgi:thiamine kinase-like enzyme
VTHTPLVSDYSSIIRSLRFFRDKKIRIQKLTGGLTNISFIVTNGPHTYVVRFAPNGYEKLGINKKTEIINTRTAGVLGIGPKFFGFDSKHTVTIVEYIPGQPITIHDLKKPPILKEAARVLKKVHTSKKRFSGSLDIYTFLEKSFNEAHAQSKRFDTELKSLKSELSTIKKEIGPLLPGVPCHLDVLLGNIILHRSKITLIDWEYAAKADYRFDLANLAVMGKFTPRQEKIFLAAYGLPSDVPWLLGFKRLVHMRESVWGMLQYSSPGTKPKPLSFYTTYIKRHAAAALRSTRPDSKIP